jgi:hypothetical protein
MDDVIALARRGAYVDLDTVEGDLGRWLQYYREHGGPLSQLTVSSDAAAPAPRYRVPGTGVVVYKSCAEAQGCRIMRYMHGYRGQRESGSA